MKNFFFIIFTGLVLFNLNHSDVNAMNSYFDDGKKLFENKNFKLNLFSQRQTEAASTRAIKVENFIFKQKTIYTLYSEKVLSRQLAKNH